MDIKQYLDSNMILYESFAHEAVFTCEQAERVLPQLPGTHTKNLLLRDKKGRRFFLLVINAAKQIDLIKLGERLGVGRLGFCSAERLQELLGIQPGSVSVLALVNDQDHRVELLIDDEVWNKDDFHCHPLVNTETLIVSKSGLNKFFELTGHVPKIISVN